MPFTTSYDTVRFDATEAILYLRVRILDGATEVETNENVPVRLPVDASGLVPVGAELTTVLDRAVSRTFSSTALAEKERLYNIAANGGLVVNRSAIYALTEEAESGSVEAVLVSISAYLEPVTSFVVDSAEGISVGSTFGAPGVEPNSVTVTEVSGNTVSFNPATFTPNFILGTVIVFAAP
jgi:hypothetical protein